MARAAFSLDLAQLLVKHFLWIWLNLLVKHAEEHK